MATLKTVRIIARIAGSGLRTVNVLTVANTSIKPHLQAAGVRDTAFETVQDSGGNFPGLRTISVSGYTVPA